MVSKIAIAVQNCVDQYNYPDTPPYLETRYRYTAVIQGISEFPVDVDVWDPRKSDYGVGDRVKATNGLLYEALNSVPVGFDPATDYEQNGTSAEDPAHWKVATVPEMPANFELFLLQRTTDATPDPELVVKSIYKGLAYPPTFQLIEPTRYSPTAQKLWSQLLRSPRPTPIFPGDVSDWDPFKRQDSPLKADLAANNPELFYVSRALVLETRDLSEIDTFKTNVLGDLKLFLEWYNNGVSEGWTTMNDASIPTGWVTTVMNQ